MHRLEFSRGDAAASGPQTGTAHGAS